MRHNMTSGGGSLIKKAGSAGDKRKLMEMSSEDRFAMMVAQKTMEVKSRLMNNKLEQMAAAKNANGESKLDGKAKKMIQMMFENNFKKDFKKAEKKIQQGAIDREKKREAMLRGSNSPQAAAAKLAEFKKQQDATQTFLKNMYSNTGIAAPEIGVGKKDDGGNGWW